MKKIKSIFILTIIFSSVLQSSLLDIIENEQKDIEYRQNIIKSDILIKKSKLLGVETIYKLNKNLNFIKNIDKDSKEKTCILMNERVKILNKSIPIAKVLLKNRDITQDDYNNFMTDFKEKKLQLSKKIKLNNCT